MTCGISYFNPIYPIPTNTTEKYIDSGQRKVFYSNYHIHVPQVVVLNQGCMYLPLPPKGHLAISGDILVITPRDKGDVLPLSSG